jgi:CBS domain-containing protein
MLARELMTIHPQHVTPDDPLSLAAELMREFDIGMIPVVDNHETQRLTGVITDRDIAVRCVARHHEPGCRVRDHMTGHALHTVHPDANAREVIDLMEREQVRRIPVVREDRALVGVIAQADLATKLGPRAPLEVERMLERVSEPVHAIR